MPVAPIIPLTLVVSAVGLAALVRPALRSRIDRAFVLLQLWHDRQRQRAVLRSLDDDRLRDIGLTRAAAEREGRCHD
ncbi:MAG: DUF1127 domain-containing protein [Gemmobacter sp.]